MKHLVVGTLIFGFVLVGMTDMLLSQGYNSGSDSARPSDGYLDSLCAKYTSSRLDSTAGSLLMREWLDGLASEHLVSNRDDLTENMKWNPELRLFRRPHHHHFPSARKWRPSRRNMLDVHVSLTIKTEGSRLSGCL